VLLLIFPIRVLALATAYIDWIIIMMIYGAIQLVTFWLYFSDKQKAVSQQWRIPEMSLHLMELLGGWPAALVSQKCFRHKNRKLKYQTIFWSIVFLHVFISIELCTNWALCRFISYVMN